MPSPFSTLLIAKTNDPPPTSPLDPHPPSPRIENGWRERGRGGGKPPPISSTRTFSSELLRLRPIRIKPTLPTHIHTYPTPMDRTHCLSQILSTSPFLPPPTHLQHRTERRGRPTGSHPRRQRLHSTSFHPLPPSLFSLPSSPLPPAFPSHASTWWRVVSVCLPSSFCFLLSSSSSLLHFLFLSTFEY